MIIEESILKMSKRDLNDMKLSEQYCLDPYSFHDMSIDEFGFSVRVNNCLKRNNPPINTIEDLLNYSFDDLQTLRNFGAKCVKEIDAAIRDLKSKQVIPPVAKVVTEETQSKNQKATQIIDKYKSDILNGNFLFLYQLDSHDEYLAAKKIKEAYDDLGPDFIKTLMESRRSMKLVLRFIEQESRRYDQSQYIYVQIKKALEQLPNERLLNKIEGFVYAYTRDNRKEEQLLEWIRNNNYVEFKDINTSRGVDSDNYNLIISFIQWCGFDLGQEIRDFLESLYNNEREEVIIKSRANGDTLNEVGNRLDVTRERIRQIEKKVRSQFTSSISRRKLILKIYATRNQDDVLTPEELQDYFGDETNAVLYLLRTSENASYVYDKDLDVLIVENEGLSERTTSFIESLPDSFSSKKLDDYIQRGIEDYDLGEEIIETAIQKEYTLTGGILHRNKLKLSSIYQIILKKYYPEGIWLYGEEELDEFREHIRTEFGDIRLSNNNRALSARIADVSILCNRGTYKAKSDKYISDELAEEIFDYIEDSDSTVFLTNTIFALFEDQLEAEGVTNKYYLQGILHELFGDKWTFRRDCISKDKNVTSIYAEIVRYIKNSNCPVSRKQIQAVFPGITDIVVSFAVNDPMVINLFGKYVHVNNISITEEDRAYLKRLIDVRLEQNKVCHCKALFEQIAIGNAMLLRKNNIDMPFALYSLLEYEFGNQYSFSRPFIARQNVEIGSVNNVLQEVIKSSDEIGIADIRSFSQDHHIGISSILELVNSCNETHLLKDNQSVICIELTGIDEQVAEQVEALILEELEDNITIPISQLRNIANYPTIELTWNEWLLYSTINKWSNKLEVGTSSNQFRYAIPLIARKGSLNEDEYSGLSRNSVGGFTAPDDLNNIDELLMTFNEDEWGENL